MTEHIHKLKHIFILMLIFCYQVVCTAGTRPDVPARWLSTELLRGLTKLMSECWHRDPGVRLTALRVKKSLTKLECDVLSLDMH